MAASSPALAFATLVVLVLALQFGPLVGLLGFRLTGNAQWAWNGLARDAAVALLLAFAAGAWFNAPPRPPLPAGLRWALWMVATYAVLALLMASGGLVLTAINLRRLVLVPLLLVAVWVIPWTPRQVDQLFGVVVATSVVVAVFGLVEVVLPNRWWTEVLDIDAFTAANNLDRFGQLPFYESGRYFTHDLQALTGGPVRRMISTYLEPTTLAAGLATLLVLALARRARGHAATGLLVLALLAGLLTLSKGFAVFVAVLMAWRWLGAPGPQHITVVLLLSCAAAAAADRFRLEGPFVHIAGLTSAMHYLFDGQWLGEGVGEAGNLSDLGSEVGEESGLGNVVAQVGWVALLSIFWLRALSRDVLTAARARRDPGGPWIAAWLLFWAVTYLFSASSLGVGGNALGFVVLALYLHPSSGRLR